MADTAHSNRRLLPHSAALSALHVPGAAAFNAIFESSAEALPVIDAAGLIHKANRRAAELLRLKDSAHRGAGLADFVSDPPVDRMKSLWKHFWQGKSAF